MKGIYCITNKINGKRYIGQAVDISKRWQDHNRELVSNYHSNQHLQSAFNKYGESAFEFTVLEQCKEQELNDKEIYYIAKYKAYDPQYGYNKTYGGSNGRHTEETKQKMSQSIKLSHSRPEVKHKMSKAKKGKPSPTKGKKLSAEHKAKLSEAMKGRKLSEESVAKMRKSLIGKPKLGTSINQATRKLTDQDVLDIVRLYAKDSEISMNKIAKMYKVSSNSIRDILQGRSYTRLNEQIQAVIDEVYMLKGGN